MYRGLYDIIAPYCRVKAPIAKKSFDKDKVLGLLDQLCDSMEEYDSIRGEETVKALSEYTYEKPWDDFMEQISKAMGSFDYDICRETARCWQQKLADHAEETEGN